MRLTCVQYTSPRRGPIGYRWLTDGGCGELLEHFSALLAEVDWSREENRRAGGICILPRYGKGIVFRKIAGLPDRVGRDKTTTNAGIFSLSDAAAEGLNGIWQLPFLSDKTEEGREETIVFYPSPRPYPSGLSGLAELPERDCETLVVIDCDADTMREISLRGNCHSTASGPKLPPPMYSNQPVHKNGGGAKVSTPPMVFTQPVHKNGGGSKILTVFLILIVIVLGILEGFSQYRIWKKDKEIRELKDQVASLEKTVADTRASPADTVHPPDKADSGKSARTKN